MKSLFEFAKLFGVFFGLAIFVSIALDIFVPNWNISDRFFFEPAGVIFIAVVFACFYFYVKNKKKM